MLNHNIQCVWGHCRMEIKRNASVIVLVAFSVLGMIITTIRTPVWTKDVWMFRPMDYDHSSSKWQVHVLK